MKYRTAGIVGISWLLLVSAAIAGPGKDKDDKDKQPQGKTVDSGSFGVFMNGRRVATEKFSIQQDSNGSVATSEFKTEEGASQAAQSGKMCARFHLKRAGMSARSRSCGAGGAPTAESMRKA